jgi:hypothetical protein
MWRTFLLVAWLGCSFPALERGDGGQIRDDAEPPIDTPTDADEAAPSLVDQQIPIRIATLDTALLQFTVQGPASALVAWSITSGGGTFDRTSGSIATNAAGVGVLQVGYTAPSSAGDRAHVLVLGTAPLSDHPITTAVRDLVPVGESTPFASAGGQSISSNFLYAQRVHLPVGAVAMRLALVVDDPGPNARLALYSDQAGAPAVLIAATLPANLSAGVNELRLTTPVQVPAGDYWIAANFETQATVRLDNARTTRAAFQSLPFASPLPTSAAVTVFDDKVVNLYVQLAN